MYPHPPTPTHLPTYINMHAPTPTPTPGPSACQCKCRGVQRGSAAGWRRGLKPPPPRPEEEYVQLEVKCVQALHVQQLFDCITGNGSHDELTYISISEATAPSEKKLQSRTILTAHYLRHLKCFFNKHGSYWSKLTFKFAISIPTRR